MARLKCSMRTAVFLTSEEYTSEPTMGQKGTFLPSSCEMPRASAVFPVPGAPAIGVYDISRRSQHQQRVCNLNLGCKVFATPLCKCSLSQACQL